MILKTANDPINASKFSFLLMHGYSIDSESALQLFQMLIILQTVFLHMSRLYVAFVCSSSFSSSKPNKNVHSLYYSSSDVAAPTYSSSVTERVSEYYCPYSNIKTSRRLDFTSRT
jgi:hypothetical protein